MLIFKNYELDEELNGNLTKRTVEELENIQVYTVEQLIIFCDEKKRYNDWKEKMIEKKSGYITEEIEIILSKL